MYPLRSAMTILVVLLSAQFLQAEPPHPWLPPFGLERVGLDQNAAFEADAIAEPDKVTNPVDLGCVFVPHNWLLLGPGQQANVRVAMFSRDREQLVHVAVWFASAADQQSQKDVQLSRSTRQEIAITLPAPATNADRDVLHVAITDGDGRKVWHKDITTMLVHTPPSWPKFGATKTILRYDAPILIRDAKTGAFSTMPYEQGWDPKLKDVVVSLPNGSRFVFWRGSSYVPFWVSRYNTAMCYEWAETGPLPDGFVDAVEPLMDKELRYGRVEIIESTPSRVHVRWTYQSTDFQYKVWGDLATEDFYFYPDGFGTRVLNLKTGLNADYELSEFIVLTPAEAYPFDVLPANLVDCIFLDGVKREFHFPFRASADAEILKPRDVPGVWRVRLNKQEPMTAIYFNPYDKIIPPCIFGSFKDKGQVVTRNYWGSHWPLARGKTTGGVIDDGIHLTPAHNSIMSWARSRPTPLTTATMPSIDTLGKSRVMKQQQWAWLIGMTDETNEHLLERARSYATPPDLEITGARYSIDSYSLSRRAMQLIVEDKTVSITVKPASACVNPVFELLGVPSILKQVTVDGETTSRYTWDGRVLWLDSRISQPTRFVLTFAE